MYRIGQAELKRIEGLLRAGIFFAMAWEGSAIDSKRRGRAI